MAPPNRTQSFSQNALEGRNEVVKAAKDEVLKGIIDNWNLLHPEGLPLNADNVRKEYDRITRATGPNGEKLKYYIMPDGRKVPTQDTIDELGMRTARAVDTGTQVFGFSFLNTIVTAIKALFSWMTGESKSFTEAYAKITSTDIRKAFNDEMDDMSKDPEHKAFIDKMKVRSMADAKIDEAVKRKAGIASGQPAPAFNPEDYIKTKGPKPRDRADYRKAYEGGKDANAKLEALVTMVADETEKPFTDILKQMEKDDPASFRQFTDLKAEIRPKLMENAKTLAKDDKANADPETYAAAVIKKTAADAKINLGPDSDKKSIPDIIATLEKGSMEDKRNALLLRSVYAQLKDAQPYIVPAAKDKALTGAEMDDIDKLRSKNAEPKVNVGLATQETVIATVRAEVDATIRDTVVEKVSARQTFSYNGAYITWKVGGSISTVERYKKNKPKNNSEEKELNAAKDAIYALAVNEGYAPNEKQRELIADISAVTVNNILKDPANKDKNREELAKIIEKALEDQLNAPENVKRFNALGTSIDDINKKNADEKTNVKGNLFKEVAVGFGNEVRREIKAPEKDSKEPDRDIFRQLKKAQGVIQANLTAAANKEVDGLDLGMEVAFSNKKFKPGHFVGAAPSGPAPQPVAETGVSMV